MARRKETQTAVDLVGAATPLRPEIGVVLGSGLGGFTQALDNAVRIPYAELSGFPVSTATGHAGELVIGTLMGGQTPLAVLSGRFHLYEGYTGEETVSGVRLLHALGVRKLVLTCAAGGLNLDFAQGALVLISDHINLQGSNPLVGENDETLGSRFPDMTEAYSNRLRRIAVDTGRGLNISLHEGVYAAMLGPSYETPAEIRFLKTIGADLVGMSTVAETIAANHLGMEVLGIACVTNLAAGLGAGKLIHSEVLEIAQRVSGKLVELLTNLIPRIAGS
ncbi:MAG TPA: purine-nucleoside phosphorylase [Bryobacteraceae bacterium]|jgi:purine-nucleoside phosphorylase|nr:purine-nucleoside phosphorylase [Bryobacteraceae bacterium]